MTTEVRRTGRRSSDRSRCGNVDTDGVQCPNPVEWLVLYAEKGNAGFVIGSCTACARELLRTCPLAVLALLRASAVVMPDVTT